ncbi:etoposide-induced protein 2.4-domain-containing protein [Suillus paluster]|uniref:etoposide-induced protein 2.4-domain-containing protein n=1 Tax=Suillus paluster TaxID=48578 RepID=UPI001B886A51|nr:etoposide-induced protein 2.4-domain-containing protein [Suillus paluster]KAG1756470.1 etoposide-induced protein 2.4-domain-containing protein [Suillus paluster]
MSRQSSSIQSPYPYSHQHQLSRSAYPIFLSLQETIKLQLTWASRGILEAFRWDVVVKTATSDREIRSNILKSLLLNSLSLTSIYAFDLLLQPLVHNHPGWLHRNVGWFYRVLWLFPVVGVSYYLNSSWCNLIAKRSFVLQHGNRSAHQQPVTYNGMLTMLATSAYRAVMILTSVIVSLALGSIPIAGPWMSFAFMCWVNAYYCFEFVWVARSSSLAQRVRHLEERWAYYFAFGLPSAVICNCGSGLANAALFALMFPAFIIMAMHARPVPQDPYNPAPFTESTDAMRFPSPLVPIRMPVFAIVIWLNDLIVRVLSVGGSAGTRHRRTPSETTEQAEEGAGVELRNVGRTARGDSPAVQARRLGERPPRNGKAPSAVRRKRD